MDAEQSRREPADPSDRRRARPNRRPGRHTGVPEAFELRPGSAMRRGPSRWWSASRSTGWGPERMARAWAELMKRLGYTRYVARAAIGGVRRRSDGFAGTRRDCSASTPTCPPPFRPTSTRRSGRRPGAIRSLGGRETRLRGACLRTFKVVDYARIMASRPQTLYGLADSPVFWRPGSSTTMTPTASRPQRSWRLCTAPRAPPAS